MGGEGPGGCNALSPAGSKPGEATWRRMSRRARPHAQVAIDGLSAFTWGQSLYSRGHAPAEHQHRSTFCLARSARRFPRGRARRIHGGAQRSSSFSRTEGVWPTEIGVRDGDTHPATSSRAMRLPYRRGRAAAHAGACRWRDISRTRFSGERRSAAAAFERLRPVRGSTRIDLGVLADSPAPSPSSVMRYCRGWCRGKLRVCWESTSRCWASIENGLLEELIVRRCGAGCSHMRSLKRSGITSDCWTSAGRQSSQGPCRRKTSD